MNIYQTFILLLISCTILCHHPVESKLLRKALSEEDEEEESESIIPQEEVQQVAVPPPEPLPAFTFEQVLQTVPYFKTTLGVLVYDPLSDKFILHYPNSMRWVAACHKLVKSFKVLANSLRLLYPDRFKSDQPEFSLAVTSADYPGIEFTDCIKHQRKDCIKQDLSPILQFGSAFKRPIIPTMVAMPMPQHNHLGCYHYWLQHKVVCPFYLQRDEITNPHGLVYPENIGLSFEELIPQVVWRGTDFSFLHKMRPELRKPQFDWDIASQIDLSDKSDKKISATKAMREIYDELIPRWKGVVWTAEAEREAEQMEGENVIPWCNIKFAGSMYNGEDIGGGQIGASKTATTEIPYYQQFEEYGIPAAGEGMSLEVLGQYKYHIDIGGGGGTTWSGTIEKLALPGLLFHHRTPTKDYFHDALQPWVHFVPVKENLSDLKDKFVWAESHPLMARRIAEKATEFAKSLGTPDGLDWMFHQYYEWPLQRVVEAYQPLEHGSDWREVMSQLMEPDVLRPILECGGFHHHDCTRLVNDIHFTAHDKAVGQPLA